MKQGLSLFALASILSLVFLGSCKPTDPPATLEDTKAPWIVMTSPSVVEPGNWNYLGDGENFDIDIRFEDDVELSNYKIQILYKSNLNYLKTENDAWEKTDVGFLDGTSDGINTTWSVIGDPNAGPYEFRVTVWDAEGKETVLSTYLFVTNQRDTVAPAIVITKPTMAIDTIVDDTVWVTGTFSDANGVKDAYLRVRTADSILIEGSELWLDTLFAGIYQLDTFLTVHSAGVGDHLVEFYAKDNIENVGKAVVPIYIK